MSEFLPLIPPPQALDTFLERLTSRSLIEQVPVAHAVGRISARPVVAPLDLPTFPRSTVDGFAVRAADTHGASESLPAYLNLIGEIEMGAAPDFELTKGTCATIHTGGMLPAGADAVVMIEHTQEARPSEIEILRSVSTGSNVLQVGEDVRSGETVIPAGTPLRAAEIGGLSALGMTEIEVVARPQIGILSSGDEVIEPGTALGPGQVYDVNSYSLDALVRAAGGEPVRYGILPDEADAFRQVATEAHAACDLLLFTAGSSVSVRDLTAQTIDALGEPGVLVHGVSVRPGKPTILAICDGKPVIGLPGNPVSALVIARIFVVAAIEKMLGISRRQLRPTVSARLTTNLASQAGREDWVGVRLVPTAGDNGYDAEPVFGKSNLIFTLAQADGLLKIPAPANGIPAGETVAVELLS